MPRTRQLLIGLVLLVLCVTPNTASAVYDSGAGAVEGAPGPVRVAKQLDAQGRVPADFAAARRDKRPNIVVLQTDDQTFGRSA